MQSELVNALKAVLLFHSGTPWTAEKYSEWHLLIGKAEITTKVLCDMIREVLRQEEE